MNLPEKSFVTTDGLRNNRQAIERSHSLESAATKLYEKDLLKGFSIIPVLFKEDFEDYELDRQKLEKYTGGQLPFILFDITYEFDSLINGRHPPEVEAMLLEYGLKQVDWFAE